MATFYKGYVTHVIDPSSFWIQIGTSMSFNDFSQYEETLDQFVNESKKDEICLENISQGDKVMVIPTKKNQSSDLQHWQRAQVTRVNQNTVDVFFIDLGYTEIVKLDQVQLINVELFDFHPAQAMRLGLAGIKPLTRSWTTRAITFFESRVLFKDVVVLLLGYDEAEAYGEVFIYVKSDNETWISLTNEMVSNEFGLPTGSDHPLVLSLEEVETGSLTPCSIRCLIFNGNAALEEFERLPEGSKESPYEDPGILSLQQDVDSSENNTCQINQHSQLLPSPADFMILTHLENNSLAQTHSLTNVPTFDISNLKQIESISTTNVPRFDISTLKQTKSISLSKMQEDIEFETRQNQVTKLELEIAGCEPTNHIKNIIDWGRSDLHIGKANAFTDVHEDISREIHKNLPYASDENELKEFFHDISGVINEETIDSTPVPISSKRETENKCLTEKEAYNLQKNISEILKRPVDGGIRSMCALVHSVLEPCVNMSHDQLSTVISAILELLICEPNVDEELAFFVLETYMKDTEAFRDVFLEILKSLKDRFVKVSQSIRSSGHYKSFAHVLAKIFLWVEALPSSITSVIQKYAVTLMEQWVVFNKQRKQDQELSLNVEMMYLECVDVFMTYDQSLLVDKFPIQYLNLIKEMKEKLLHTLTNRSVRSLLLDLLLRLHNGNLPLLQAVRPSSVDVATQTYDGTIQIKDRTFASLYRTNKRSQAQAVFTDDDQLMSQTHESIYYSKLTSSDNELSSDGSALSRASECNDNFKGVPNSVLSNDHFTKLNNDDEACLKENQNSETPEFCLQPKESQQISTSDSDSKEKSASSASNMVKWKSLSELLPQGSLWPQKSSESSTSVDPDSYSTKLQLKGPESNIEGYKSKLTGGSEQTCDSGLKQSNIPPVPEWPEHFFTSVQVDSTVPEETYQTKAHQDNAVKPGKKKKTKFVPLSNYVKAAQSNYDEISFETGQDYIEEPEIFYRDEGQTFETSDLGKVIHSSRLGALAGSSSKRSLFADLRKQVSTKQESRAWIPSRVVCSSCKKEGHLIYDCPNDGEYQTNREDQQYLLL